MPIPVRTNQSELDSGQGLQFGGEADLVAQADKATLPKQTLAAEAAWVMAGQALASLGGLACIRVMTDQLPPETYGKLALLLTFCTLVTQVLLGGTNAAGGRFYAIAAECGQVRNFASALLAVSVRLTAIGGLIAILGVTVFGVFLGLPSATSLAVAFTYAVVSGLGAIVNSVLNAARLRGLSAIHQAADAWLRVGLLAVLFHALSQSPLAALFAYALAALIVTLSQTLLARARMRRESSPAPADRDWRREIVDFSLPYVPWTLVIWLQQCSDRWALGYFATTHEVGAYAVIFQLGYSSLIMLFSIGMRFIQPIVYQAASQSSASGSPRGVKDYNLRLIAGGLSVGAICFILASMLHVEVFTLLVGADYRQYSPYLPWMVLCAALFGASEVLLLKMQSDLRVRRLSQVKVGLGVAGIAFNLLGAAAGGLNGIVVALVVFNVVNLIVMAAAARTGR